MAEQRIVIAEDVWGEAFEHLAERRPVHHESGLWQAPERLAAACHTAEALVVRNRTKVNAELLHRCPRLRIIARAGVGLDNIDVATADEAGIVVTAPLGANATSVAEHALGLALTLARGTVEHDTATKSGSWQRRPGTELRGGTWGLLGAGATARACGRLARALGMRVLAYDPYLDPQHPELDGITLAPLDEVAGQAEVLSCHLPATPQTTGLVDAALLERMREHALLVNVGRGEILDENALADALAGRSIAGAALDVRAEEPPRSGRLETAPNLLLTPHIAGITTQSQRRILEVLATDIDAVLDGEPAHSAVGACR